MLMKSAAGGSVVEPQTTTYQRVPYNFPGVGIWLPTTENDACKLAGKQELQPSPDKKAKASLFKRLFRVKVARRTRVSPDFSSKNSNVKLTPLEEQYLDYLRRSVGTGQFSHYLMPA